MKITVLGTGRWASTNIWIVAQKNHDVLAWDKFETDFLTTKKNRYVDCSNYSNVRCTTDLKQALDHSDFVIVSILSQKLTELMQEVSKVPGYQNKRYCLAMKGVEATTGRTLSEILMDFGVDKNNIAILAGPGQPESIVENQKINKMVVSSYNSKLAFEIPNIIGTDKFTLFPWPDVRGNEFCAAAKNVYSALGGICEGAGQDTLKGQIMSASLHEMSKYLRAMDCEPETVMHFSLLADYKATMFDPVSHNLNYGIEIVKQNTVEPVLSFNSVEGRYAVQGLLKRMADKNKYLSDHMQHKAPLLTAFDDIVNKKIIKPQDAVKHIDDVLNSSLSEWARDAFDMEK